MPSIKPYSEKTVLVFGSEIQSHVLQYHLRFVPTCVSVRFNNIILGHETGFVHLSALPKDSKVNASIQSDLAKSYTFKLLNEYSDISGSSAITDVRYSSRFIVAINLEDMVFIVDHLNAIQFQLETRGKPVKCFDICGDYLAVIYESSELEVWNLSSRTRELMKPHLKGKIELVKFHGNTTTTLITAYSNNVIEIRAWKDWDLIDSYRLGVSEFIRDLLGLNGTVIHRTPHAVYLRPSLASTTFGHYLLEPGVLEFSNGQTIKLPQSPTVTGGEVTGDSAAVVAGAHLYIIKF